MSVDLAVWDGPQPASDEEAATTFEQLYDAYERADDTPPTDRIASYVGTLLVRYPDLTELDDDAVEDSPWADGPLIDNAVGPFLYIGMASNAAAEGAWEYAVNTARSVGLVCFDPQASALAV